MCEFYTNGAEGVFSRLRRAETGHPHDVAGADLIRYARGARGLRGVIAEWTMARRSGPLWGWLCGRRCRLIRAVTAWGAKIKFGLASRKVVKHLHSNGFSVLSNLSHPITNGFSYVANNLHAAPASASQ